MGKRRVKIGLSIHSFIIGIIIIEKILIIIKLLSLFSINNLEYVKLQNKINGENIYLLKKYHGGKIKIRELDEKL